MYWSFGWLLISGTSQPDYPLPDAMWFCLCVSLCIIGSVIMIAADAQKYFTLRVQRGLITDGMHRYVRHPNYLGEMMRSEERRVGKECSVRVDLGVRRIIKKKKKIK